MLVGPDLRGLLGDAFLDGVHLALGILPFCLVLTGGLLIKLHVTLNLFEDQQQVPCIHRSGLVMRSY